MTLTDVVGIADNPTMGTTVEYSINSTSHTWYPVDFAFTEARSSVDYQVHVTQVKNATDWMVVYRSAISDKTVNGFHIDILVDEGVASGTDHTYNPWSLDIIVF